MGGVCAGLVVFVPLQLLGSTAPEPIMVTCCGEPVALSAKFSVAPKLATDGGVKVTFTTQVEGLAAVASFASGSDAGQVLLVMAKSVGLAPVTVMPLMSSGPVPLLVSVIPSVSVEPTRFFWKFNAVADSDAPGAPPEPVSATVCGLPLALSATDSAAA